MLPSVQTVLGAEFTNTTYAALSMATAMGIEFREGFMKNRYIGRTFIMPGNQSIN